MNAPANPYAFPSDEKDGGGVFWTSHEGMTLRDWFAGQAGEEDISAHRDFEPGGESWGYRNSREAARYAYADAMLAERAKGGDA